MYGIYKKILCIALHCVTFTFKPKNHFDFVWYKNALQLSPQLDTHETKKIFLREPRLCLCKLGGYTTMTAI